MKVLGVSYSYHDASATLVVDGVVRSSAAEERFSYEKHDPSFPRHAIHFCLKEAGISGHELDFVAYNEDPFAKFTRSLSSSFKHFPWSSNSFLKSSKELIAHGFWVRHDLSKFLNVHPDKIIYLPHHLSHAAHSFLTSGFDQAAVVTIDAVGEWGTACIFDGVRENNSISLTARDMSPFPHSLGLLYSAFTAYLGFKVNDGECSTMALAAYGQPKYLEQINKILNRNDDGTFGLNLEYFDFSSDEKLPITKKFIDTFGPARAPVSSLPFQSVSDGEEASQTANQEAQRYADIAASVQLALEEAVLGYAKMAQSLTNKRNLCYAGGVALNCVANSKLTESRLFERYYVPPDPGDGGAAMGAALYISALKGQPITDRVSPYLGKNLDPIDIKGFLSELDPSSLTRGKIGGLKRKELSGFEIQTIEEGELADRVAQLLHQRQIVGWAQGRFENGPRALGHRSILCRPDCTKTAARLSQQVKLRESFRPYAASILAERADQILEPSLSLQQGHLTNWMQSSFRVIPAQFPSIQAACHIDGTTRAQLVTREAEPRFHQLIEAYGKLSGTPALLNTSFNAKGFPLVSNAFDAILMFVRTDMDALVIGNTLIEKTGAA